jgi:dTDP-glucose 4,6-dehydratase
VSSEPRRALVTGGAGFLGSHLCDRLLAEGWEVEAVDNLSTGTLSNLEAAGGNPRFAFRRADVAREPLRDSGRSTGIDAVFHLACPASPVQYLRLALETLEVCASGTARALELAGEHGAVFVLASTSEVYGDPAEHPQRESYFGNVDPVGPRSMYDEGKRYAEALSTWHRRLRGIDARIVRIFNTYGPRMNLEDGRMVPTFVRQALADEALTLHGDGSQTRTLCYVSDLIAGLWLVATAERDRVNGGPINLGGEGETTVRAIADQVRAIAGSASPVRYLEPRLQDPYRRRPDLTRANALLSWSPRVDLDTGLKHTIAWARRSVGA